MFRCRRSPPPVLFLRRVYAAQQATDSRDVFRAGFLWNQRIGGFLHPVLDKPVRVVLQVNEFGAHSLKQLRMDLRLCCAANESQPADFGGVAGQASFWSNDLSLAGRRLTLPTMSSTILSVHPFA